MKSNTQTQDHTGQRSDNIPSLERHRDKNIPVSDKTRYDNIPGSVKTNTGTEMQHSRFWEHRETTTFQDLGRLAQTQTTFQTLGCIKHSSDNIPATGKSNTGTQEHNGPR